MVYNSYSGNRPPANSRRVNIEPDEDRNTDFNREGTQLDTQGNIVSTAPPSFNETGQIKFRRDIYSPVAFKQKVDTSFSELNNQSQIDIPTFFKEYNRLFFDIPKQGANSHETIINESKAYFQDYIDPKDSTITSLNGQINELNSKILELELALISGSNGLGLGDLGNSLAIGDPFDPNISWGGTFEENGLLEVFKRVWNQTRNNTEYTTEFIKDGAALTIELDTNNNISSLTGSNAYFINSNSRVYKNIEDAYNRSREANLPGQNLRKYSQWKQDIDRESSGKSQKDAFKMLDYLAAKITNDPDTFNFNQ